jgi:hypothetical protein
MRYLARHSMRDLASSFEKLLGRQPSEQEVQSLYRVKNALNIGDNDALWLVLMALQSYDSLYRKYPAMISAEMAKVMEAQRVQMAAMADVEIQKALHKQTQTLSPDCFAGAQTSQLMSWAWFYGATLLFGSLCMLVGAVLASGHPPFWVTPNADQGLPQQVLGALARTPAGWMAFVGGASASGITLWKSRHNYLRKRKALPKFFHFPRGAWRERTGLGTLFSKQADWHSVVVALVLLALSITMLIPTL